MIATIAIISMALYIGAYSKLRMNFIAQQVAFIIIYLAGLTIVSDMDVLLPIYFVASFLPLLRYVKELSYMTLFLGVYFLIYLVFGMLFQNFTATAVTFISRYWQFMVFFVAYDTLLPIQKFVTMKPLYISLLAESVMGIYLMLNSTMGASSGLVRLVSKAQPITGNIAVVVLPISIYLYCRHREDTAYVIKLLATNVVFLIWIILSGTRGYTLVFVLAMFMPCWDYFFSRNKRNFIVHRNRKIVLFSLLLITIGIIIVAPEVTDGISSILRLKDSVGVRTFENAAEMEFFFHAPIGVMLLGIGAGGTAGHYSEFVGAIYKQLSLGMWGTKHYLYDSGVLFHNLFANILLTLGVVGILVIIAANIEMWKRITRTCKNDMIMRSALHLFQIGFLLMNYYRWSSSCGIAEMIILALVLKSIQKDISLQTDNLYKKGASYISESYHTSK